MTDTIPAPSSPETEAFESDIRTMGEWKARLENLARLMGEDEEKCES